jgi:hypothetical protein
MLLFPHHGHHSARDLYELDPITIWPVVGFSESCGSLMPSLPSILPFLAARLSQQPPLVLYPMGNDNLLHQSSSNVPEHRLALHRCSGHPQCTAPSLIRSCEKSQLPRESMPASRPYRAEPHHTYARCHRCPLAASSQMPPIPGPSPRPLGVGQPRQVGTMSAPGPSRPVPARPCPARSGPVSTDLGSLRLKAGPHGPVPVPHQGVTDSDPPPQDPVRVPGSAISGPAPIRPAQ